MQGLLVQGLETPLLVQMIQAINQKEQRLIR